MAFVGWQIPTSNKPASVWVDCEAPIVHLSTVTLVGQVKGQVVVYYNEEGLEGRSMKVAVAVLTNERPSQSVDLFVSPGSEITLEGASAPGATVHVAGYKEDDMNSMEDEDETDSEEEATAAGQLDAAKLKALLKASKPTDEEEDESSGSENEEGSESASDSDAGEEVGEEDETAAAQGESSSDEEAKPQEAEGSDSESDDEAEGSQSDAEAEGSESDEEAEGHLEQQGDEDESDSEEEEVEETMEEKPVAPVKESKREESKETKKAAKATKAEAEKAAAGKKRKASSAPENVPPSKKEKGTAAASTPECQFEASIVEFLKSAGGSAQISMVGAKVKRPAGLKTKLGSFLKERTAFEVTGGTVQIRK